MKTSLTTEAKNSGTTTTAFFNDFPSAWWYLADHPKLEEHQVGIMQCLDIAVAKINPTTGKVDDDDSLNIAIEIWLEFGFPEYDKDLKMVVPVHDIDLDCGASFFEEAIIKLANLVERKYPNN